MENRWSREVASIVLILVSIAAAMAVDSLGRESDWHPRLKNIVAFATKAATRGESGFSIANAMAVDSLG